MLSLMSTLVVNPSAKNDYHIQETFEAGLKLRGYEVKAVKAGKMSLKGAYVRIKDSEPWLIGASIAPYQPKNTPADYKPDRARKLLFTKKEIGYLLGKQTQVGLTIVPLRVYTKKGKLKLEVGIGKGLKKADKRERLKRKEFEKRKQRLLRKKL